MIDCTKLRDKIWARVERESCGVFFIPIDFCIEFGNSISPLILEYTEAIFLTIRRELSNGANPGCVAASVLKLFKFFLQPTQLGHTINKQPSPGWSDNSPKQWFNYYIHDINHVFEELSLITNPILRRKP